MEAVMKRKQRSLSIEKCSILSFEKGSKGKAVREAIICNQKIKFKEKDDYLEGLGKSVNATIDKRYSRIFSAIIEVSSILNDFRIYSVGGLKAGLEFFEMALLPSLLYNADTWVDIDSKAEIKLEKLQNSMFRYLFGVPDSTPKPILRFDLGNLSMIERVHVRNLNLLYHLKNLEPGSLGAEFYNQQVQYNFKSRIRSRLGRRS